MICFPLDNTEYEANGLGAWLGTRTRGVFSADGHYAVTANGDMSVTLSPGLAWIKPDTLWGAAMMEKNPTVLPIATADGLLVRYAAVCLRLDKNLNAAKAVVKYGQYGTNPDINSLPLPEQNSLDYDEIYVAAIRIRAGATEILPSDITDLRLDEAYCGVMRDGVTGIPTQELYNDWYNWFVYMKKNAGQQFKVWFEHLQDELDENQAGNLLNLIDQHQNKFNAYDVTQIGETYEISFIRGLYPDERVEVFLIKDNTLVPGTAVMDDPNTCIWTPTSGEIPSETHKIKVVK